MILSCDYRTLNEGWRSIDGPAYLCDLSDEPCEPEECECRETERPEDHVETLGEMPL